MLRVPAVALLPAQPPDAVHDVAFVLDHVSIELPPAVIDAGLAPSDSVAAGVGVVGDVGCVAVGATTVMEVGLQAEVWPAESTAQTSKS